MSAIPDEITNNENIIDSRDVDERIDYLESLEELEDYESDELENLKQLKEDVNSSEWEYGLTLISDSYFEEYAEDFAYDIGAAERGGPMEFYIDWEKWANDLQMDYSSVDFDGVIYWYLMS